jgi:hypothetical protein
MRKISLVLVAAMLLSVGTIFGNNVQPPDPVKNLSAQIGALLNNNYFIIEDGDVTAKVKFIVNQEKEIVVLHVESDSPRMEVFIKSRLNYQKVDLQEYREGRTYTIPVRIVA